MRIKSYWGFLGLRLGAWKSMSKYKYLIVLQSDESFSDDDFTIMATTKDKEIHYELYLMSDNHLSRIMLSDFKDQKDAFDAAKKISDDLGLEFVKYNPGQLVHQKPT